MARRSVRSRRGMFVAEGPQAVREAVRHRPDLVRDVYVTAGAQQRHAEVLADATTAALRVHRVSDEVLAAMGDTQTPQGLLAVCRVPAPRLAQVLSPATRLVCVLAQVRDPGNAGTVLRAADAAGADAVVVSDGSVDVYGPKSVRSSAGSLFHLPVVTGGSVDAIVATLWASGLRVLAADGSGDRLLGDVDLRPPHAWVMGNEAWGLREEDLARCDEVVRVPIHGQAESLNLAMAATVCLYASATAQHAPGTGQPACFG